MRKTAFVCFDSTALLRWSILVFLLVLSGSASSQLVCNVNLDRSTVEEGGTVVLTVTAEGEVSGSVDFKLPQLLDAMVAGTSYSRSQSFVNGRSSVSIAKTFYLSAQTVGDFKFGPVVVTDRNTTCQTEPVSIKITPRGTPVSPSVSGNRVGRPNAKQTTATKPSSTAGKSGDDFFITLETDRQTVWVGQQVVLTFRYYHRVNPWSQPQFQAPRTPGFWRESLGAQKDFRTTVSGRAYNVTEVRYAIFPTRAGELTIEGAELSFPDQGLDRFFSSRRRNGPRTLRTAPIEIQVKKLPEGQPDNFSGLVASTLRLTAQADLDTVPRGEALDLKVRLVSDAFLKGFEGLKVPSVENVRMHHAGDDFRTNVDQSRLLGQITLEKVLVPSQEGRLPMPRVSVSWFDAKSGRYRVSNAAIRPVTVVASDNPYLEQEHSGFLRNEVSRLGQDLVFIHNVPSRLNRGRLVLVQSPLWWLGVFLPVLLLGLYQLYLARRQADPVRLRRERALEMAQIALADPGQSKDTSEILARAINGFVADCTNRPLASVGPSEVRVFCQELGAVDEGERLLEILESCDTARYGGNATIAETQNDLEKVKGLLAGLHTKKLVRISKLSPTTVGVVLALAFLGAGNAQASVDPARLMAEGNQAYTEGQVGMALDLYRQAQALGVQDADLYFNLGNAHARNGELGFAVANYLRAQRLAPHDQDIEDNLAWVRGNIQDLELGESQMPLFIAQMVSLVFAFTLGQWAVGLLVLVWVMCGLLVYKLNRGSFPDNLRRAVLMTGACLLMVAVVVFWRWRIEEVRQTAVVVVEEVAVRSGPDESFGVQFMVHDGLTIRIQEERRQWVRISLGGESLGWMPINSIEIVREKSGKLIHK